MNNCFELTEATKQKLLKSLLENALPRMLAAQQAEKVRASEVTMVTLVKVP